LEEEEAEEEMCEEEEKLDEKDVGEQTSELCALLGGVKG